jgi:DNA-binding HxlR family transcriptional regulator
MSGNQSANIPTTCRSVSVFDEAMKLLGDFWTLRIVDAIRHDEVRFCEIERRLPAVNPATLSARLKKLEEQGLVSRTAETIDRQSVCYSLTPRGFKILPVLESIKKFTNEA